MADVVHFGDVGLGDFALAAAFIDGATGVVRAGLAADVVDDDFGAFAAEAFGDGLADAGTASGDDGDFSLQTVHGLFSRAGELIQFHLDAERGAGLFGESGCEGRGGLLGELAGVAARIHQCTLVRGRYAGTRRLGIR